MCREHPLYEFFASTGAASTLLCCIVSTPYIQYLCDVIVVGELVGDCFVTIRQRGFSDFRWCIFVTRTKLGLKKQEINLFVFKPFSLLFFVPHFMLFIQDSPIFVDCFIVNTFTCYIWVEIFRSPTCRIKLGMNQQPTTVSHFVCTRIYILCIFI